MKTRICAIGVIDSIELVKQVSVDFSDTTEFTFYTYESVSDILQYIEHNKEKIDVIMFTGRYPYNYIKNNLELDIPYFALSKTNETLFKTFWKIRNENIDYNRISIDRSPRNEIFEILDTLGIAKDNIHLIGDSSEISLEKIYEFHKKLFDEGITKAIITSNYKIYKKLLDENYKVYRILPSRYIIRESIKKAISIARTEKIKSTQVVVQTLRIKDIVEDGFTKFKELKLINKFDEMLIDYTQENQGSFFKFGSSDYMIFTTRGFVGISEIENKFGRLVEKIEKLGISFSMGIGYGDTVTKSENNSKLALNHALKENKNACFIIDDNMTITGPIFGKSSYSLSYELVNADERIHELAEKTGVSEKYLSKLKAIIKQSGNNSFDTEELAEYLNLTQRSASRIINKLEFAGIADNIGKKSEKVKGRPKKVYQINLD